MFSTVMIEAPITGAIVAGMVVLSNPVGAGRPVMAFTTGLVTGAGTAALAEVSGLPGRSATQSMDVIRAMTVVGAAIGTGAAIVM